ncbi:recombinase family protein [uncultured Jannaschia sp.]|uniref:recombinase family protein n=1 Tax=uncultured Jannaschia sp. TaxID=293347 RepID=UPI0026248559|nr:recombinase family protein [uncultured Jannaschia sp.]
MIIGYARVSTECQSLEAQLAALEAAGVEKVFSEKISGSKRARPALDKLIEQLREGDIVTVTKYDRLSRSLQDLLAIVEAIRAKGAGFRSLAEDIDTTTSAGRLVFHVFASIAQFERERISERTREGLAAARKAGRIGGRPPALSHHQREEVRRLRDEEGRRIAEIARLFDVSPNTVRRA